MPERLSHERIAGLKEYASNWRGNLTEGCFQIAPSLLLALAEEVLERRAAELRIIRDSELGELKRMLPIDGHGWLVMHVNDLLAIVDAWLEREADESAERSR